MSDTPTPLPTRVLVVFALVFPAVGGTLAAVGVTETWAAARKVEARGAVAEARVVYDDHPPPRSKGPWVKEWLAEYETADGPRRRWVPAGRFGTKQEAKPGRDVGRPLTVWHTPGEDDAATDPPDTARKVLWTAWSAVIAAAGVLSVYALAVRCVGRGRRPATG